MKSSEQGKPVVKQVSRDSFAVFTTDFPKAASIHILNSFFGKLFKGTALAVRVKKGVSHFSITGKYLFISSSLRILQHIVQNLFL